MTKNVGLHAFLRFNQTRRPARALYVLVSASWMVLLAFRLKKFVANANPPKENQPQDESGAQVWWTALFNRLGLPLLNSVFASSSTNFTNPE
jgi:hypothetical protein